MKLLRLMAQVLSKVSTVSVFGAALLLPSISIIVLSNQSIVDAVAYAYPSTNEQNQAAGFPNVTQESATTNTVTLNFLNTETALSYFEYRIDGALLTSGSPHPVVSGDFIYPGVCIDTRPAEACPAPPKQETFTANSYVEIRLALGGERDWDFDWTRFDVANPDPTDSHQLNMSGTLYRDHKLDDCDNKTECEDRSTDLLSDWNVRLYKEDTTWELVDQKTTNELGVYKFTAQKAAGTYHVCEVLKPGWTQPKQTWSGSGYLVRTDNLSGDASEGPYCTTTIYTDESDKSSKSNIGNVDMTAPEIAYFTSPPAASVQNGVIQISAFIEDYGTGLGQQQIVMRRPDNSIAGNWSYNVKSGSSNVIAGSGVISYTGNEKAGTLTITLDTNSLSDGQYNLRLFTKDAVVNGRSNIYSNFFVDNTPPSKPSILGIYKGHNSTPTNLIACAGFTNNTQIRIDWSENPETDIDYYWIGTKFNARHKKVSASQYDANMTPGNNPYFYTVIAVDKSGNESEISEPCSLTLDQVAPVAAITSHSDGQAVGGIVRLTGEVIDDNPMNSYFRVANSSGLAVATSLFTNGSTSHSYNWNTTGVDDGIYTVYFEARDKADNKAGTRETPGDSVDVITLVVDNSTTAPVGTRTSAASDQSPTFEGTAEQNSTLTIEINGIFESSTVDEFGNWLLEFTDEFAPGEHTAYITATDTLGNSETTELNFTITNPIVAGGVIDEETPAAPQGVVAQNTAAPAQQAPQAFTATAPGNVLAATDDNNESTTEDDSSTTDTGNVLQSTTDDTQDQESEKGCFKVFGLCWYWTLIIFATLLGVIGYLAFGKEDK